MCEKLPPQTTDLTEQMCEKLPPQTIGLTDRMFGKAAAPKAISFPDPYRSHFLYFVAESYRNQAGAPDPEASKYWAWYF